MLSKDTSLLEAFENSRAVIAGWLVRRFVDETEVDDILQETYLKALENEGRGGRMDNPRAYLFMIARNIVFKNFKRRARARFSEIDLHELPDADTSVDTALHERNKFGVFAEAVSSLPEQCRRVFIMRKLYGYPNKQIAKELGISVKTVENHLTKALKRCGRLLQERGYTDIPNRPGQTGGNVVTPDKASTEKSP